jgi:hypothetical protein
MDEDAATRKQGRPSERPSGIHAATTLPPGKKQHVGMSDEKENMTERPVPTSAEHSMCRSGLFFGPSLPGRRPDLVQEAFVEHQNPYTSISNEGGVDQMIEDSDKEKELGRLSGRTKKTRERSISLNSALASPKSKHPKPRGDSLRLSAPTVNIASAVAVNVPDLPTAPAIAPALLSSHATPLQTSVLPQAPLAPSFTAIPPSLTLLAVPTVHAALPVTQKKSKQDKKTETNAKYQEQYRKRQANM